MTLFTRGLCLLALGLAGSVHAAVKPSVPDSRIPVGGAPVNGVTWTQTLERIASGVVTIQIDSTSAFDTEWNLSLIHI